MSNTAPWWAETSDPEPVPPCQRCGGPIDDAARCSNVPQLCVSCRNDTDARAEGAPCERCGEPITGTAQLRAVFGASYRPPRRCRRCRGAMRDADANAGEIVAAESPRCRTCGTPIPAKDLAYLMGKFGTEDFVPPKQCYDCRREDKQRACRACGGLIAGEYMRRLQCIAGPRYVPPNRCEPCKARGRRY
jgi:hypothetical protein